jgi:hypothetical protein
VAAPEELCDRTTHGVSDRDEPVDAQRIGERDDIVRDVLERERLRGGAHLSTAPHDARE